jgi:pimeloyl-ACP methyl ester carboxylesterase
MGGLEAALFATSYPDEVAGIFLIDSMAPDITITEGTSFRTLMDTLVPGL